MTRSTRPTRTTARSVVTLTALTAVGLAAAVGIGAATGLGPSAGGAADEAARASTPAVDATPSLPASSLPGQVAAAAQAQVVPAARPSSEDSSGRDGLPLLVTSDTGEAALYELRGTTAERLAALSGPAASRAVGGAVASEAGTACVVWRLAAGGSNVSCGDEDGTGWKEVAGIVDATAVALRPDGGALAWVEESGLAAAVMVAPFADGVLGAVTRVEAGSEPTPEGGLPEAPASLAFSGDSLLLGLVADSDEGRGLVRLGLDDSSVQAGWLAAPTVVVEAEGRVFDRVTSADATSVLLVSRPRACFCDEAPVAAEEAVRLSLADGRVTERVATADAAAGRVMAAVSGAGAAQVYVTDGPTGTVAHVRRAGEPRGAVVTGLPADLATAVTG